MTFTIDYIFGAINDELQSELKEFWDTNRESHRSELRRFKESTTISTINQRSVFRPLRIQTAATSRDSLGRITGIVFVALRTLDSELHLGSHAYFQRMFVLPDHRAPRLSNQLYTTFLREFQNDSLNRDHRARHLLAENVNPGLRRASMRRYFARHGFKMVGQNKIKSEIWALELKTTFNF